MCFCSVGAGTPVACCIFLDQERLDKLAYAIAPYPDFSTHALFDALTHLSAHKRVTLLIRGIHGWRFTGRGAVLQLLDMIEQLFRFAEFPHEIRETMFKWIDGTTCEKRYAVIHSNHARSVMLQELSHEQQQTLFCLLDCEYFWYQRTNLLEVYALPATKQELCALLGRQKERRS